MRPRLSPTLTLFTKQYCGLCESAKETILRVQQKVPFVLTEVDIEQPANKEWLRKYMFDVPVLHAGDKLVGMHRFTEREVEAWVQSDEISQGNKT
ncbi:hypothetical protein SpCBS45565_g01580 [Spizellomyces sp. 'palustris']|nr:hypothetical protein SpCBS45565_g01580 [Spizellomyces sp. 'palustris']